MATYSMRARQATLPAIVGFWILRGVARQIGFDVRAGTRSSKELFRDWAKRKWQSVPQPVRVSLFAIGVTARAGYRAARHADKTISTGVRMGYAEGRARHAEFVELRKLRMEWPKTSTHLQDAVSQVNEERKARKEEHRSVAQQLADQRRAEKEARPPLQWPGPVVHEAPLAVRDEIARTSDVPPCPTGGPDGGTYSIRHAEILKGRGDGYSKEKADALAAWLDYRFPDAKPAQVVLTDPSPDLSGVTPTDLDAVQDNKENTTNGGSAMTAPSGPHGGDVMAVADLRRMYEAAKQQEAVVVDQQIVLATQQEELACSFEAACGGLSSEGFDQQTIAEAQAALDAIVMAAEKAKESAAATDNATAMIDAAHKGLERHRLMEEAVANAGQTAHRTAAYAAR